MLFSTFRSILVLAVGVTAAVPASADTVVSLLVPPSFTGAFGDIAKSYEQAHPGVRITISAGASKIIAEQLEAGAAADLAVMGAALAEKTSSIERPIPIIADHTVIAAARGGKVKTAKNLAMKGVRLGWGIKGSITEKFEDDTLANLTKTYGASYAPAVMANVLVHKSVGLQAEKAVEEGTIDAAIVLASNTMSGKTEVIDLGKDSVAVVFSAGVVKSSKNADVARRIVAFTQSPAGQAILKKYHQTLGT